jgi:hypothetical protein
MTTNSKNIAQFEAMEINNAETINGGFLSLLGGVATMAHTIAETVIKTAGISTLFAPIDAAIVHPLLWNPLTAITGVDVAGQGHINAGVPVVGGSTSGTTTSKTAPTTYKQTSKYRRY